MVIQIKKIPEEPNHSNIFFICNGGLYHHSSVYLPCCDNRVFSFSPLRLGKLLGRLHLFLIIRLFTVYHSTISQAGSIEKGTSEVQCRSVLVGKNGLNQSALHSQFDPISQKEKQLKRNNLHSVQTTKLSYSLL